MFLISILRSTLLLTCIPSLYISLGRQYCTSTHRYTSHYKYRALYLSIPYIRYSCSSVLAVPYTPSYTSTLCATHDSIYSEPLTALFWPYYDLSV